MERRAFVAGSLAILAAPLAAAAQQTTKVCRIGLLPYSTSPGRNIVIEGDHAGRRAIP